MGKQMPGQVNAIANMMDIERKCMQMQPRRNCSHGKISANDASCRSPSGIVEGKAEARISLDRAETWSGIFSSLRSWSGQLAMLGWLLGASQAAALYRYILTLPHFGAIGCYNKGFWKTIDLLIHSTEIHRVGAGNGFPWYMYSSLLSMGGRSTRSVRIRPPPTELQGRGFQLPNFSRVVLGRRDGGGMGILLPLIPF